MATPAELGYRMPAEWEPHQATWLSWPHKEASWPGIIDRIWPVYARFVAELARGETVHINVNDAAMAEQARAFLAEAGATGDIRLHEFPTNDAWCRDHGAIFVVRDTPKGRQLAATDWEFNAWGNKYPPYDLDNQIPARMAEYLGVPRFCGGMVLEGGSIDVDGNGLLLTTEQCLLNPNRNPHLDRQAIEQRLRDMLGVCILFSGWAKGLLAMTLTVILTIWPGLWRLESWLRSSRKTLAMKTTTCCKTICDGCS